MRTLYHDRVLFLLISVLLVTGGCTEAEQQPLEWPEVERTHQPWTRWWWMGSAVDEATLSELLTEYAEAGIGGVEITPIYGVEGREDAFIDYLSPSWMAMLDHTVREADRLGMGVDMANGSGWPFGGPEVTPGEAARRLVLRTYALGEDDRLADSVMVRDENVNQQASLEVLMAYSASDQETRNLTNRVDADGQVTWGATGDWRLYAAFGGWTGQEVKRAAPGAEGYVIDHFSDAALESYLSRFDQAFEEHGTANIRAFFNDSYEVYGADWTPRFFGEFRRHRGYDLHDHLPALAGDSSDEKNARVQTDYRETLSDLLLEKFVEPWVEWTHAQDAVARNQAHGAPANLVDLYAAVDIPETETFHASGFEIPGLRTDSTLQAMEDEATHPDPLVFKFASSGAHLSGSELVSSETGTWLGEHFRVSLAQIKPEVDQLFTAGINHVFFHGTPYSPPDEPWPGWLFYASTHFGPTNTFWRDLPALTSYIARTQSFLQSGQPDNDVLLYFPIYDHWQQGESAAFQLTIHNPDEWFYETPVHDAAQSMQDRGYAFDYVSDRLLTSMQEDEGAVQAESGTYDVVVLPAVEYMPVSTFEHLMALARSGATVVVQDTLPQDVPGWRDLEDRRASLDDLRQELAFENTSTDGVREAAVGEGRFLMGNDVTALLAHAEVRRESMVEEGLSFARRQHEQGRHYFLTNLGGDPVADWIPLGTEATSAVLFDPMHAREGVAAVREGEDGAEVYVQLEPGASRILRTFATRDVDGPGWTYLDDGTPDTLEGTWDIAFIDGGPEQPKAFSTEQLDSWTVLGDEEASRFAGTARYRLTFEAPSGDADDWTLDLGRVGESARVFLNGQDLGRVWAHPFTRRVGEALQPGENHLEIEVTNLMANRIADLDRRDVEWKKFYDINFVSLDYEPFDASTWSPMASGLLGPVTLIPGTELRPEEDR